MAKWFLFHKDFDYAPNKRAVLAYKKGTHVNIPDAHIEAALAAGVGEVTDHEPSSTDAKDGTQPVVNNKTIKVPSVKG